eukprot:m.91329 g.91329  ORF g.91329 m.91329 type:complete len:417 (-) comp13731_c0_seq3:24-1274(-)
MEEESDYEQPRAAESESNYSSHAAAMKVLQKRLEQVERRQQELEKKARSWKSEDNELIKGEAKLRELLPNEVKQFSEIIGKVVSDTLRFPRFEILVARSPSPPRWEDGGDMIMRELKKALKEFYHLTDLQIFSLSPSIKHRAIKRLETMRGLHRKLVARWGERPTTTDPPDDPPGPSEDDSSSSSVRSSSERVSPKPVPMSSPRPTPKSTVGRSPSAAPNPEATKNKAALAPAPAHSLAPTHLSPLAAASDPAKQTVVQARPIASTHLSPRPTAASDSARKKAVAAQALSHTHTHSSPPLDSTKKKVAAAQSLASTRLSPAPPLAGPPAIPSHAVRATARGVEAAPESRHFGIAAIPPHAHAHLHEPAPRTSASLQMLDSSQAPAASPPRTAPKLRSETAKQRLDARNKPAAHSVS